MYQTYARNHQKSVPHLIGSITREADIPEGISQTKCRSVTMALEKKKSHWNINVTKNTQRKL